MSGINLAGSYAALLRRPAVARTFGLALVGRLAYGMLPLALLFTIHDATGSFAQAATGAALNGLASLSMPLKARAIDRHGQRLVVPLITASAVVVLCGGVALARSPATAELAWWGLALAIGLASPPLGPSMRAQWRSLVPADDVPAAYALDAVGEETLYLLGPMLAAAMLTVAPAYAGLAVAAALLVVGAFGLAASPVATSTVRTEDRRGRAGPLRHRPFLGLLAVMALVGATTATLYTSTAARALAIGRPEYAGLADAGVALGSVVGGLLWGRLPQAATWRRSLARLLAFLGSVLLVAGALPSFALFALALTVAGLAVSPVYVVAYRAGDRLVDPAELTEAGTWVTTVTNLGISAGAALSGALVGLWGAHAPGWAGAALALLLACALGLGGRVVPAMGGGSSGRRTRSPRWTRVAEASPGRRGDAPRPRRQGR